jgi:hypothetical protein
MRFWNDRQEESALLIGWLVGKLVGWFIVFNATFNNISVISWRSVLLVEETGVPEENHQPVEVTDKLYQSVHIAMNVVRIHNFCGDRHWEHR